MVQVTGRVRSENSDLFCHAYCSITLFLIEEIFFFLESNTHTKDYN